MPLTPLSTRALAAFFLVCAATMLLMRQADAKIVARAQFHTMLNVQRNCRFTSSVENPGDGTAADANHLRLLTLCSSGVSPAFVFTPPLEQHKSDIVCAPAPKIRRIRSTLLLTHASTNTLCRTDTNPAFIFSSAKRNTQWKRHAVMTVYF